MYAQPRRGAGLSRLIALALCGAALAGCATSTDCTGDPRTDNVWCADKALASGDYELDTADMATTLADEKRKVRRERATGKALRARLADLRTRRQRIEQQLSSLLTRLRRIRQQRSGQQARIASLESEIAKALQEQRLARARLDEEVRRIENAKGAAARTPAEEEKLFLREEAAVLNDEQGIRLFARQVDEVTRT